MDRRYKHVINVRLTDTEIEELKQVGGNLSAFIRSAIRAAIRSYNSDKQKVISDLIQPTPAVQEEAAAQQG